jgi:hypothetical protein
LEQLLELAGEPGDAVLPHDRSLNTTREHVDPTPYAIVRATIVPSS